MEVGALMKGVGKAKGKGKRASPWKGAGTGSGGSGQPRARGGCGAQRPTGQGKSWMGRDPFTPVPITGFCGRCGKKVHKQKDCWSKLVGAVTEGTGDHASASSGRRSLDAGWQSTPWDAGAWETGQWAPEPFREPAAGTLAAVTVDKAASSQDRWFLTVHGAAPRLRGTRQSAAWWT